MGQYVRLVSMRYDIHRYKKQGSFLKYEFELNCIR